MTNKPPALPVIRDPREPLPLSLGTLDFVAPELHEQYARQMDGTWKLAWINKGDTVSHAAHLTAVAEGRLDVLPDGETPVTRAANAALRDIDIRLAINEAEIAQTENAAVKAETQRADRARYDARQAERRRLGLLTDDDFRALRVGRDVSDEPTPDDEAAA